MYASFEDFVNFLIYSNPRGNLRNDANWRTYTATCTPCENRYDVIIKLETLEEDLKYLKWESAMEESDWLLLRGQNAVKTTQQEVSEKRKIGKEKKEVRKIEKSGKICCDHHFIVIFLRISL